MEQTHARAGHAGSGATPSSLHEATRPPAPSHGADACLLPPMHSSAHPPSSSQATPGPTSTTTAGTAAAAQQPQLVVFDLLKEGWGNGQHHDVATVLNVVLKQPDVFVPQHMAGAVYCGTDRATNRRSLLLDASVLPLLQQRVLQLYAEVASPPDSSRRQQSGEEGQGAVLRPTPASGVPATQTASGGSAATCVVTTVTATAAASSAEPAAASGAGCSTAVVTAEVCTATADCSGNTVVMETRTACTAGVSDTAVAEACTCTRSGSAAAAVLPRGFRVTPRMYACDKYKEVRLLDVSDPKLVVEAFRAIMKHNNAVKKETQRQARLKEAREQLRQARVMVAMPASAATSSSSSLSSPPRPTATAVPCVLVSVDLEWYEGDPNQVLEIGWSCWDSVSRSIVSKHWIVDENLLLVNSKHVPNHKHDFRFGTSVVGPKREGVKALQRDLQAETWAEALAAATPRQQPGQQKQQQGQPQGQLQEQQKGQQQEPQQEHQQEQQQGQQQEQQGQRQEASQQQQVHPPGTPPRAAAAEVSELPHVALVGHGMAADLKMLDAMGVDIPPGTEILDTANLAWALVGGTQVQYSLRALLSWLEVPDVHKLHNAGNDARYTLEALLMMCKPSKP